MSERPSPERTDVRQATIKKLAKRAIKAAGIDIPSIALVREVSALVAIQCEETRARLADMVRTVSTRGSCDEEHMVRLAWILENHWLDENGDPQIDEEAAP